MSYVKTNDVEVGTKLKADGGFTCLKQGDVREVREDDTGSKFIECSDGEHHLDGQLNGEEYIGLTVA